MLARPLPPQHPGSQQQRHPQHPGSRLQRSSGGVRRLSRQQHVSIPSHADGALVSETLAHADGTTLLSAVDNHTYEVPVNLATGEPHLPHLDDPSRLSCFRTPGACLLGSCRLHNSFTGQLNPASPLLYPCHKPHKPVAGQLNPGAIFALPRQRCGESQACQPAQWGGVAQTTACYPHD